MERAFEHGLFPPPASAQWRDGWCDFSSGAIVKANAGVPDSDIERLVNGLRAAGCSPIAPVIRDANGDEPRISLTTTARSAAPSVGLSGIPAEGFVLEASPRGVTLAARDGRGMFYAVDALVRMAEANGGSVPNCRIDDEPSVEIRGVHLFLPARADMPFFLRLLDFLARHRYNTIYLEIAAGMEFRSHPEINRAWEQFSRELMGHPGGQKGLQESMWFDWKNDPHVELGGGSWLTRDEVGEIVAAAAELHLEIIPEVQSLAHAYWLTIPHPEIAEAQDDAYPDTYCPSNPLSYEIMFDCMEEIVDVIQPRTVHIGHDEVYTMHRCPACRRKTAAELFAEDVTRIHDWLSERGIRTVMWCDKLLDIRWPDGQTFGGVQRRVFKGKKQWVMPPTARAVESIPRDIGFVDWYWMLDDSTPDLMADRGFSEIVFGHYTPGAMPRWKEMRERDIIRGAEISTWVGASEDVLARHVGFPQLFIEGASNLWWSGYDPDQHRSPARAIADALAPAERDLVGDRVSLLSQARANSARVAPIALDASLTEPLPSDGPVSDIAPGGGVYGGIAFSIPDLDGKPGAATVRFTDPVCRLPVNCVADGMIALIGSSQNHPKRSRNDEYHLGQDVAAQLRFHYGAPEDTGRDSAALDLVYGGNLQPWNGNPRAYWSEPALTGTTASGESRTFYAVEWTNAYPDRAIRMVELVWRGGRVMEGEVFLLALSAIT